jgi:hypothetical protein
MFMTWHSKAMPAAHWTSALRLIAFEAMLSHSTTKHQHFASTCYQQKGKGTLR